MMQEEQAALMAENMAVVGPVFEEAWAGVEAGGDAFESMAGAARNAIKKVIKALIAEGIAAVVSKTLGTAGGGPWAVALAGLAGAAAAALFNKVIPAFAAGGVMQKSGMALVGEKGPEVVNLKAGQRVHNNRDTMKIFDKMNSDNAGIHVTIQSQVRGEDIYYVVEEVKRRRGNTK